MCEKYYVTVVLLTLIFVNSTYCQENEVISTAHYFIRLAKLVSDFRNVYHTSNIFIARRDPSSELPVSRALTTLIKTLSNTGVFSIITQITDIPRIIDYSKRNLGRPVFVVIIRSNLDLTMFANATRTANLHMHRTLVIFTKNMHFCHKPVGNPLHLVFDMRMWVVCQDFPIVREWYSLEANETVMNDLFVWTADFRGFQPITNLSFYERRNSLKGKSLRVTVLEQTRWKDGNLKGFFGTLLSELGALADFKIDLQPTEKVPGSYDPVTKRYSGIMGKLRQGKTDIGAGDLTISEERLDFCDFSKPMLFAKANFYIRKASGSGHLMWSMYFYAFGIRTSYCLVLFLITTPFVVAAIVHRYNKFSFAANVYENYLNVWGIFCAKSPSDFPDQWSARIAYYSLYVLAFMLYSAYSALLVSYLANFNSVLPFYSLEEFVAAKTHKIITVKNTSYIDTFKISSDKSMRNLNSFLLNDRELPSTINAAISQACDKNKKVVLYMDDAILSGSRLNLPCELIPFERGRFGSMALAFVKHSPYVGIINYHLQRLRNIGVLSALRKKNQKRRETIREDYKPVDLYSTMPAFGILYFGMVLSAILMIVENCVYYCIERHRQIAINKLRSIDWSKFQYVLMRKTPGNKVNNFEVN